MEKEKEQNIDNPEEDQQVQKTLIQEQTFEFVPIGAVKGADNQYRTYLLASYNQEKNTFETTCTVGTARFSQEEQKEFQDFFQDKIQCEQPDSYSILNHKIDVWFKPSVLWEIKCSDIALVVNHSCSMDNFQQKKGICLKFPKFLKVIQDKSVQDATSSGQIYELYSLFNIQKDNISENEPNFEQIYESQEENLFNIKLFGDQKDPEIKKKLNKLICHKRILPYINIVSYIYTRISRNLNYDFSDLEMEDFIIDVSSLDKIYDSYERIISKVLSIIFQRYLVYPINNDSKDTLILQNNERIRELLSDLGGYFQDRKIYDIPIESKMRWLQNQNYEENQRTLKADLFKINLMLKVMIQQPEYFLRPTETFKYFSMYDLDTVEPFLGYTGVSESLLIKTQQKYKPKAQKCYRDNDMRGLFAHGKESPNLYVCWHGSNNEFDWDTNFDSSLFQLRDNILPELPRHWRIHTGFTFIVGSTWNTPQTLNQDGVQQIKLFRHVLEERMQGKKTVLFTGHSQGAGLAQLACLYLKYLYMNRKEVYDIKGWFISVPRFMDRQTALECDELFGIQDGSFDMIRQNVLGDPVPLGFENVHDLFLIVKRGCAMLQVVVQSEIFSVLKAVLSNREFVNDMLEEEKQELIKSTKGQQQQEENEEKNGFFANLKDKMNYKLFESEVLKPLEEKYDGNFPLFLVDYTAPGQTLINKGYKYLLWNYLAKKYRDKLIEILPEKLKSLLNITEKDITHKVIRNFIHNTAKIIDISDPEHSENMQNLIFDSDYQYYNTFRKTARELDSKKYKGKNVLEECCQMTLAKEILKSLMKSRTKSNFYFKEISYFGEILEGFCYFCSSYSEAGVNFQDRVDFHQQCQRVGDLNLYDRFINFSSKKNEDNNSNNNNQQSTPKKESKNTEYIKNLQEYSPLNNVRFQNNLKNKANPEYDDNNNQDINNNNYNYDQNCEIKDEEIEEYYLKPRFTLNESEEVLVDMGDQFEYSKNPTRFQKAYEFLLQYFGPYHYGGKQATLSPELLHESDLYRMYEFGKEYAGYTREQKDDYFYSVGILQKNRELLMSMFKSLSDFGIVQKRIIQKLDASEALVEEIESHDVESEVIMNVMCIVAVFQDLRSIDEDISSEQNRIDQLNLLTKYSYFLSSYYKALQTVYCLFDSKCQTGMEFMKKEDPTESDKENQLLFWIDFDILRQLPFQEFLDDIHKKYRELDGDQKADKSSYLNIHSTFLFNCVRIMKGK